MQTTNKKYILAFLSSLLSFLSYSLETIKLSMLKRLIKWKRELDYRVSPEILHYREQREIENRVSQYRMQKNKPVVFNIQKKDLFAIKGVR